MFYAIQHDEVLCKADSIPSLKKELLTGGFDFTDEDDRRILIVQRHSEIEVQMQATFKEVKGT